MSIREELGMHPHAIDSLAEEAVLNLLHTADRILKHGRHLFGKAITQAQFNILMVLSREPDGIFQKDLARRVVVTKGNVSQHVANLEADGLLRRRPGVNDHRYRLVTLTPKGARLVKRFKPRYVDAIQEVMGKIPEADTLALIRTLSTLRSHLRN